MATNKPQDDYKKTALRLPPELHERLHEAATASGRSYNAEIVARLEQTLHSNELPSATDSANRVWLAMLAMSIQFVQSCTFDLKEDAPELFEELSSAKRVLRSIELAVEATTQANPLSADFSNPAKQLESLGALLKKYKDTSDPAKTVTKKPPVIN
jgi:predicted DNA-binding protein